MNKRWLLSIALVVALIPALACQALSGISITRGSGNVISQERQVSNFHQVDLSGIGDIILTQGDQEALTIDAEDNLMPLLRSDVQNGTLFLGLKDTTGRQNIMPTKPITFKLSVKNLDGVSISGSGSLQADSLKSTNLDLHASGSGKFIIHSLTADSLNTTISGSGDGEMAGEVKDQSITLSGSGNYQAGDLKSETCRITISGAGKMTVWATNTLDVRISGSGDVSYYGNPTLTKDISGSGTLNSLGNK